MPPCPGPKRQGRSGCSGHDAAELSGEAKESTHANLKKDTEGGRPTGQIFDHRETDAGGSRLPRTVCESVGERWRDGAGSLPHLGCAVTPVVAPMLARAADGPDFGPCGSLRQASAPTTRSGSRIPAAREYLLHRLSVRWRTFFHSSRPFCSDGLRLPWLATSRRRVFCRRRSALRSDSPPILPQLRPARRMVPLCRFARSSLAVPCFSVCATDRL